MELPDQVRRQAEAAAEFDKQMEAQAQPPAEEPEAEPTQDNTDGIQPVAEEPQVLDAQPDPVAEQTWEARYKTLRGMFDAEVPQLHARVKELEGKLDDALTRLNDAAQPAKAKEPKAPLVTDKDVETFGSDLIDLIKRQAEEIAAERDVEWEAKLAKAEAENARLQEQVGRVAETQGVTNRRTYFAELSKLVPDYEVLNVDDGFITWLAEVDPLSGLPRQAYMNNAFEAMDVTRTANLFLTYKQMVTPPAPEPEPRRELERQVAPGSSKSDVAPQPASNTRVWTTAEVDQFYRSLSRGDYRGREQEAAQIEQQIDLAVAEGRLR